MHYIRPRLQLTVFMRKRYGNVLLWPTVYTGTVSNPESNDDDFI